MLVNFCPLFIEISPGLKFAFNERSRDAGASRHSGRSSAAAASLALRGKPGVAEDTRQRILDATGRVGYQIRATAEVPAEFTIGMLVITRTRGTPEATYGPLMGAITQACSGVGVDVRLGTLVVDESDRPMEVPRLVGQAGIDGFLVIGPWLSSAAASLLGDRPIVLVDGDAEDRDTHSSVVSDDAGGAADQRAR